MIRNFIKSLRVAAIGLIFMLGLVTAPALAAPTGTIGDACNSVYGNGQAPNSALCQQDAKQGADNPVANVLHIAATILAMISAVIAVIMIIIAGLTFITSRGDSGAINTARNRIIYSVVGLLIIAAAWAITTLLIDHIFNNV